MSAGSDGGPRDLPSSFSLTRARLRDLVDCPRRFWLRNVARLRWPAAPPPPAVEAALVRGRLFHQQMHRHFLGLGPMPTPEAVQGIWKQWQRRPVRLPPGRLMPETTLSVPLANSRLVARYDLLVLADDGSAIILDWKTDDTARSRVALAQDIQTWFYPFVLAEGGAVLNQGAAIPPDAITMVYWQVTDPDRTEMFPYSAALHAADRRRLEALAAEIAAMSPDTAPTATDDQAACGRCTFRSYCRRDVAPSPDPDLEAPDESAGMEPPD